jgi:N-acetylglucosamine-6-phosphate deacetylase
MVSYIQGLIPKTQQRVEVSISEGYISGIRPIDISNGEPSEACYLAPGLLDIQVNGYGGVDFSQAGLTLDMVNWVTRELWKEGVVSYLPTVISGDPSVVKANLAILAGAMGVKEISRSIAGVHLEGPYISAEDGYRGAHNACWIHPPKWEEFLTFYHAAQGHVVLITLAPEIDGALEFIHQARNLGIVIALGHHNAPARIINLAVESGAAITTHLGNGCANKIDRHINPLWPQLAEDRLMASIIADGAHLTPEELKVFYKVKGPKNLVLISDMTKLAGLPSGEYLWDQKKVLLAEGRITYPDQGVLAGSAMPLKKGMENMMQYTDCTLEETILMAATNPARLFKWNDRGLLEVGKTADIIQFNYQNGQISIIKTLIAGQVVFGKDK